MKRLDALKELAAKVEAGSCPLRCLNNAGWGSDNVQEAISIRKAFHGSLDAALAVHNAVLPGWHYFFYGADYETLFSGNQHEPFCVVAKGRGGVDLETHRGNSTTPARAWLLAILRALIAMEENPQ